MISERLTKALNELKDPNSDTSKRMREYVLEEARKREVREKQIDDFYKQTLIYEDLDDFINEISLKFKLKYQEALDKNTYIETIDEQWLIVEVALKYGRVLTKEEKFKYDESDAVYFRGWLFGILHGQGSYPWYYKVE